MRANMMSKLSLLFLCAVIVACGGCVRFMAGTEQAPPTLTLAEDGATDYSIVIAGDASPSTQYGAEELQRFLGEISGAEFAIKTAAGPMSEHEIILGDSDHLRQLGAVVDFAALGDEGYVIRVVGKHLVIAGGALRGNLYGAYGLLEDYFGCKWFTPEVSRIPKRKTLGLPKLNETRIPELEYREPFVFDCFDGDWCARNRMNSSTARLDERHGGKVRFGAGMFVHTFNRLVPPEKYFADHPEYFSLVDGERVKDQTQLCTTNEEVVQLCIENVKKAIEADPEAFVYSVSQNDWHNYCECDNCTALYEKERTWMAPVLQLVNCVAEAIEDEYPDKAIETLAYQYTRKAPKTMRPRKNVIVRLCSIECCFMHPLDGCDSEDNREFTRDARAWAKVADRLWVWDYVTSFRHYMTPFPNLRVRDDNIRFFIANNVKGIFEQDAYQSYNGEFNSLSGYLNAKHLWNKEYGEDRAINEFLEGVYGAAATPIREYIDMLHDKVAKDNIHADIWIGPNNSPFLTDEIMKKSEVLWERAEKAVANQPDTLQRVQFARLSYEYAWLEKNRHNTELLFDIDHANFTVKPHPVYGQRVRRFFETIRTANVTLFAEHGSSLDQYEAPFIGALREGGRTFEPIEGTELKNPKNGTKFSLYKGTWEHLPDFAKLTADSQGITGHPTAAVCDDAESFALSFTGYFKAEQDGVYSFSLGSNDGSRMTIAGEAIDNDGLHPTLEVNTQLALKKGYHPFTIEYFQAGGSKDLYLKCTGPDMKYGPVPMLALYHDAK